MTIFPLQRLNKNCLTEGKCSYKYLRDVGPLPGGAPCPSWWKWSGQTPGVASGEERCLLQGHALPGAAYVSCNTTWAFWPNTGQLRQSSSAPELPVSVSWLRLLSLWRDLPSLSVHFCALCSLLRVLIPRTFSIPVHTLHSALESAPWKTRLATVVTQCNAYRQPELLR